MATKSGQFVSRDGRTYEVRISGANVAAGTLTLGVPPVVISMAGGEHKFNGFKTTQCVVNIATDYPMTDLYSSDTTDIHLTVEDLTNEKVEFDGYVLPFAFDQTYTGKGDTFTVNAVDRLTARKGVKYVNTSLNTSSAPYGTDRYAHDIVGEIAHRAGLTEIVVNLNFNGVEDAMYTDSPLNVKVAQAGFLQDEVSDLDTLSAICKFFGYTACVVGLTLYLYDEHCLVNAPAGRRYNANVYRRNEAGVWAVYTHYYNQGSPIIDQSIVTDDIHNDISVTIERAYDGIQITPEGSDVSMLLPDVCDEENMEENNNSLGTSTRVYSGSGYVQYRTPRRSKLMRTGKTENGNLVDFPSVPAGDWMKPNADNGTNWLEGAIPMKYVQVTKTYINDDSVEVERAEAQQSNMIWMRAATDGAFVAEQRGDRSYSHTGGYVELGIAYRQTNRSNWQKPEGDNLLTNETRIKFLQLKSGDKYLVKDGHLAAWGDTIDAPMYVKQNKLLPTDEAIERYDNRFVAKLPNNGQVTAELRGRGSAAVASDYYIESLYIKAVGDAINEEHSDMRHIYASRDTDVLGVSTMLTTRKSGATGFVDSSGMRPYGVNARPSVVTDTAWKGGYMGRSNSEAIPISGILMEQLKARYAQPRVCYKMTVDKNINPCAAVVFGSARYTVEAYDRDLYNSTTYITID